MPEKSFVNNVIMYMKENTASVIKKRQLNICKILWWSAAINELPWARGLLAFPTTMARRCRDREQKTEQNLQWVVKTEGPRGNLVTAA